MELKYTLLTDGRSDRILIQIINWLLNDITTNLPIQSQFADFSLLRNPPSYDQLELRIKKAIELYPCDILFVHRDAERDTRETRKIQVQRKINLIENQFSNVKFVIIVPVRMMETWLLINLDAIKKAAGKRNCRENLILPESRNLELHANPKLTLHNLIKQASEQRGRRLDSMNINQAIHRVAENITDFSPLRNLSAFRDFEQSLVNVLLELEIS